MGGYEPGGAIVTLSVLAPACASSGSGRYGAKRQSRIYTKGQVIFSCKSLYPHLSYLLRLTVWILIKLLAKLESVVGTGSLHSFLTNAIASIRYELNRYKSAPLSGCSAECSASIND